MPKLMKVNKRINKILNIHSAKGRENISVGPDRNHPKAPSSEGFREQKNSYGKHTMTLGQRKSK